VELQKLLVEHPQVSDPTWEVAQEIVEEGLRFPSPLINLIRNSWSGLIAPDEFIKFLGFTGLNPACLIDAAEMPTDGATPRTADVAHAVQTLGIRFSSVVVGVNVCVRNVLKRKPGPGWRSLLHNLATDMEIGYKIGVRVGELGLEGGLLIGFFPYAGLGILSAVCPEEFKLWNRETKKYGTLGRKRVVEIFECEPYQVGALVLQQLGFGTEIAFGSALAVGKLNPKHISIDNGAKRWKAGYEWVHALKDGRNYPADVGIRKFFPAITPPTDRTKKNPMLEVLYTEVGKMRHEGSTWTWHLPKPGYERTKEAYELEFN
jgi:hypothetical protein